MGIGKVEVLRAVGRPRRRGTMRFESCFGSRFDPSSIAVAEIKGGVGGELLRGRFLHK